MSLLPGPEVEVQDLSAPRGPRGLVPLRMIRPRGVLGPLPAIIYIRGNGWMVGNTHTHDRLLREMALGAQAAVLLPYACMSSAMAFGDAMEDVYAVAQWVLEQGEDHGLDPGHLVLAGDSIGGNLAAGVSVLAKWRGGPRIAQQLLFYPVKEDILQATLAEIGGLPPALVINTETQSLRLEGEALSRKLQEAAGAAPDRRLQGDIQDLLILKTLAITAAARGAVGPATDWLREAWATERSA